MMIVATAGWGISRPYATRFRAAGTGLERYAGVLGGVEINSSFYRPHKPETYARWAKTVPEDFRFAVKCPRTITHEKRLAGAEGLVSRFLDEAGALGRKLGPLLIQLPPSLRFERETASSFFDFLRARHPGRRSPGRRSPGAIVCEPRHASWFSPQANECLLDHAIARVVADPALVPEAALPGGFMGVVYVRLHGSPLMYHSAYDEAYLAAMARLLAESPAGQRWCVFDNTASGAALGNALALQELISQPAGRDRE